MTSVVDKYDAPRVFSAYGERRFHALAKPAGSRCNLDCTYCFYLSKENLPGGPGSGDMDPETLELFIRQCIAGVSGPEVVFSWQGGEPTLRGLEFFRTVFALQKEHAKPRLSAQPSDPSSGWRARTELSLLRPQTVLSACSTGNRSDFGRYKETTGGPLCGCL